MDRSSLIDRIDENSQVQSKIDAIDHLAPFVDEADVLTALCREAVETDSHPVREAVIKTLKRNPEEANRRFCSIARCSESPVHRRWALICLSLMACRNAKAAVLQGLGDPHRSVRTAAALHIGLYRDPEVIDAFELFFERDRPLFIMDNVREALKPLAPLMKRIGKACRGHLRHDNLPAVSNALDKKNSINFSSIGEEPVNAASIGTSE